MSAEQRAREDEDPKTPEERVDAAMDRMDAAIRQEYAIVHVSPRRWAVMKRKVMLCRTIVGYGSVSERSADGSLGRTLGDPIHINDWTEYEPVEGCHGLDHKQAMRALALLQREGAES